jgi:hypothetical protein
LEQVAKVVELAHVLLVELHTGSVLHLQAAAPAAPVQLWCAPHGCATKDQHPLAPSVHDESWPETQLASPFVHVLVQQLPSLHAPFWHAEIADSYTQPCPSVEQRARVMPSLHAVPAALHTGSIRHVQAAEPAAPVQVWCAPGHAIGVPYAQKLCICAQYAISPETHAV